ncbi:MAG: hypothetical protein P8J89_02725 [Phycisphaerales bacterium]|nr:hypothetical protein [Phycisphaerales bacterium]
MPSRKWLPVLFMVSFAGLGGGCTLFDRTTVDNSAVQQFPGNDQDFDFWDSLAKQPVVTNDDALHGLLLLSGGKDDCETYECRYEAGITRGWFDGSWGGMPPADESARVGWVAVAACQILEIKGGLTMRLFGDSPRYCSRELTFMGLLPSLSENEALTGLEFTALVDNIEDRQRLNKALEARKKLKQQQEDAKTAAETKRISEVLTPMHPRGIDGADDSNEADPDASQTPETADSESTPGSD